MNSHPVRITQITDCHLGESSGDRLLSMNPDEGLHDVLALMNQQHPNNDLLLLTGDLANEPSPTVYKRLHNLIERQVTYPFAWLAGNHDDPEMMKAVGDKVNIAVHALGSWIIILLDSRVPNETYGEISENQLKFLQRTLEQHTDKHIMVSLHHQPVPINSAWMDRYIVRNADDFWHIINAYSQVNIVLWGHIHQEFSDTYNDIALLATPSTCVQFKPNQHDFCLENTMPGYRWFELNSDGSFETGVERVAQKSYGIDFSSVGY
ncbi:MAG: Icc protein [Candidatus Endobugula sp.]|jgi:Icc protein